MSNNFTGSIDITAALFDKTCLVTIPVSSWTGTRIQNESDEEVQGAHIEKEIYGPGSKILIKKEALSPFLNWRTRIKKHLERNARKFHMRGIWILSKDEQPKLTKWLMDARQDFNKDVEIFLDNYETHRASQIALFNEKYPDKAGSFDADYPTREELSKKFSLSWTFFTIDAARLEETASEERENFRQQQRSYLNELAGEIRSSAVQSCARMLKSLNVKSGAVNLKQVEAFKSFAERFKSNNFLGDADLDAMITQIQNSMFNIKNWTSDEVAASKIKELLSSVVEAGQDEGATAEVATSFIRRVSVTADSQEDVEADIAPTTVVRRVPASVVDLEESTEQASE